MPKGEIPSYSLRGAHSEVDSHLWDFLGFEYYGEVEVVNLTTSERLGVFSLLFSRQDLVPLGVFTMEGYDLPGEQELFETTWFEAQLIWNDQQRHDISPIPFPNDWLLYSEFMEVYGS